VVITAPTAQTFGIRVAAHSADAAKGVTGANHKVYNNLIKYGNTATSATQCFNTDSMPTAAFDIFDYNLCFFEGATKGKWDSVRSAAGQHMPRSNAPFDTHSSAADPMIRIGSAPLYPAAIDAASPARTGGHPTLRMKLDRRGCTRTHNGIGAFEYVASACEPK
jgi:hypothetical protein